MLDAQTQLCLGVIWVSKDHKYQNGGFDFAGACAASCICQACGGANRAAARFVYAAIFFITVILAWIIRDYSDNWLKTLHRESA